MTFTARLPGRVRTRPTQSTQDRGVWFKLRHERFLLAVAIARTFGLCCDLGMIVGVGYLVRCRVWLLELRPPLAIRQRFQEILKV